LRTSELIQAIEAQFATGKPSKAVVLTLMNAMPEAPQLRSMKFALQSLLAHALGDVAQSDAVISDADDLGR
jgi:type IV secretory pathway VirB2 component (pilin)